MSRHLIDTAVLETYRRSELEDRVTKFTRICDKAIANLNNLKATAKGLVNQLSCDCDPDHLRDSFLSCMSQLDEYNYVVSEFQLSIAKFDPLNIIETDPEQDTKVILKPMMAKDFNLMDLLTEPSTSGLPPNTSVNFQPKPLTTADKIKLEDSFIIFSSSNSIASTAESTSQISEYRVVTADRSNVQVDDSDRHANQSDTQTEYQNEASHELVESGTQSVDSHGEMIVSQPPEINSQDNEDDTSQRRFNPSREPVEDSHGQESLINSSVGTEYSITSRSQMSELAEQLNDVSLQDYKLPATKLLRIDTAYNAVIIHVEEYCFYVVTENFNELERFWVEMTKFYSKYKIRNAKPHELIGYKYCACYDQNTGAYYRALTVDERDGNLFNLYLVDTGEKLWYPIERIYPLMPPYFSVPAYAHCCQLSRVEVTMLTDKEVIQRFSNMMKQYLGELCVITVDDNVSDIYAVTVYVGNNLTLNQLILSGVFTQNSERQVEAEESDFETEDALVAATGYHNRDEATNCKYATRGENCPRGERCKLTHNVLFPDGWTRDRVEVVARLPEMPLPPVGAKVRVHVVDVCHYDRMHVHFLDNRPEEELPKFGERFYPTTLTALVRDMNIEAERVTYRPLELEPAPGEIVAALYPLDNQVYRAQVINISRGDQTVQVKYLDYGNKMWVRSANVYHLSPMHCALPAQAVGARLALVTPKRFDNRFLTDLHRRFSQLVLNKHFLATVLGHENDGLVVSLEDNGGLNIGQQMLALGLMVQSEEEPIAVSQSPGKPKQLIVPG